MIDPLSALASLLSFAGVANALRPDIHRALLLQGRPQIGLWKALSQQEFQAEQTQHIGQQHWKSDISSTSHYKAHCFEQPISHFDKSVNGTFCHRYWIDASSYKPGGPVFLLDGGETSGADRLPFLEKGILQILSNATNGLGIVLEHRYYGKSVPVSSFSTDDLRFLNNAEALEDSANFIKHFRPPTSVLALDSPDALHPNHTAWIYYGGSYAGARAAHMRTQYPELVWGAIASSAVTHAQVNFPQYFDPIQQYAPAECIAAIQSSVKLVDTILDMPGGLPGLLKNLFGLGELENDDFAEVLQSPLVPYSQRGGHTPFGRLPVWDFKASATLRLQNQGLGRRLPRDTLEEYADNEGYWQAKNWDPKVGSDEFQHFCDALTAGGGSSTIGIVRIPAELLNYAKYIKENIVSQCPEEAGVVECFGSHNDAKFKDDGLDQTWRLWLFQVCTQWGYFMPAPLEGPSLLSKHLTLEHSSKICKQAYPPGKHFTVPEWPDVEEVNRRGDYTIEMDRLAFMDGDRDPWRPMTPQADLAPKRESTIDRPRRVIFDGVHHYDENGLTHHSREPERIKDVHAFEVVFIKKWVKDFEKAKRG